MCSTREPFRPFLSKFSAAAEGKASALIEETEGRIGEIKKALHLTKKWEEDIIDGFAELTRTVDKFLGDDQSITKQPLKDNNSMESEGEVLDFFSTEKGKNLLAIAERVEAMASKVSHDFRSSTTASSPSLHSEGELKELPVHEEELQRMAEKVMVQEPRLTFLQVIYDELDPQLKQCLLCFSVFPENIVIKRRVVIYWWVGEGLVVPSSRQTAEQVGEDCFKTLILSHLIQPIYQKHSKTAKYCKIYPWVRQMLVSKAKESEEEFFTFDPQGCPTFNSNHCKRACLVAKEEKAPVVVTLESKHELRSIFNLNAHYISWDKDQLRELKAIAALQVGRWQNSSGHHIEFMDTKFFDSLQFLKELRYLSLEGISRITELPKTIAGLNNLLILNLRSCHNLEKVTPTVTSIASLTHLDVSECYLLDRMPQGIGSITNLQVLKGFVVGSAQSTDSCRLSELTQLKKLWKLSIRIGSEAVHIGEDLSELSKIKSLQSLKITWGQMKSSPLEIREPKPSSIKTMKGSESMERSATMKERTAPAFSHPYLEKLVLECVPDDDSVTWLTPGGFTKLKRLYIAGGKLRKLSPLTENDGWNVEILRLKFLKELKLEWVDLKTKLQQLRCAQIYKCPKIVLSPSRFDDNGYWERNDEEASSSSMAGTSAPV